MKADRSPLGATVFEYGTTGFDGNNRELWAEVAQDMAAEYPETYRFDDRRPMSLTILDSAQGCTSDSTLTRFRVIRVNVLRTSQHTVLIELSLGNCFSVSGSDCLPTADIGTSKPGVAKWIRAAAMIPLREHVGRVRQFVIDADDAGWSFPQVEVDQVNAVPVMLANGQGGHEYRPKIARALVKVPVKGMHGRDLVVVGLDRGVSAGALQPSGKATACKLWSDVAFPLPKGSVRLRCHNQGNPPGAWHTPEKPGNPKAG